MTLVLFWIAAPICAVIAAIGAIASTEPTANAQPARSSETPHA